MTRPSLTRLRTRRAATLIELLIALGLVLVLGIAITRLLLWQSRFYDAQAQGRAARSASRSGMNMLLNEWRMLNVTGLAANDTVDVDTVSTTELWLRVPFASGLMCANSGGGPGAVYLSMLPVDSLSYAQATDAANGGFVGYGWRDASGGGQYHYVELASMPTAASTVAAATQCLGASIGAAANGAYLEIRPGITVGGTLLTPVVGTPVYLYQRLRYRFAPSVAIPGATALWRDVVRTSAGEEIAAPLASGSQFAWYLKTNSGVATTTAPAVLASIAGFAITLNGVSERVAEGAMAQANANVSTSVYFRNRMD